MVKIQQYFRYLKDGAGLPWKAFRNAIIVGAVFAVLAIINDYYLQYDSIAYILEKIIKSRLAVSSIYFSAICFCVLLIIYLKFDRLHTKTRQVGMKLERYVYVFYGIAVGFLATYTVTQGNSEYIKSTLYYISVAFLLSLAVRALASDEMRHVKWINNLMTVCLTAMIGYILYILTFG